jgi:hypothetical protein
LGTSTPKLEQAQQMPNVVVHCNKIDAMRQRAALSIRGCDQVAPSHPRTDGDHLARRAANQSPSRK